MVIGDTVQAARQRAQTWRLPFLDGSLSEYHGMTMTEIIEQRTRELEAEGILLDALRLPVTVGFAETILCSILGGFRTVGSLIK